MNRFSIMPRKIIFFLFFCVGKIHSQSGLYPDSIATKSLRISGLATNQKGMAVVQPNGKITNQSNFRLFIPAASFTPIDNTTAFHNTGEYCYFDIGTTYAGLIAPLILPDSVIITEVSLYMRVYGGTGQQILTLNKSDFAHVSWGTPPPTAPTNSIVATLSNSLGPGDGGMNTLTAALTEQVAYTTTTGLPRKRSYYLKLSNSSGVWGSGMVFSAPPTIPNRFYGVLVTYKY
jgi:hypothetical protein